MTKKLLIFLIGLVTVLIMVSMYILFIMPSEDVYNGVLIKQGLMCAGELIKAA